MYIYTVRRLIVTTFLLQFSFNISAMTEYERNNIYMNSYIDSLWQWDYNYNYHKLNAEFDRNNHPFMGASYVINVQSAWDPVISKYRPAIEPEDRWVLSWEDSQSNLILNSVTVKYVGQPGACWSVQWEGWPEENMGCFFGPVSEFTLILGFYSHGLQCLNEDKIYSMKLVQNGIEKAINTFTPSVLRPGIKQLDVAKTELLPNVPDYGQSAESTSVMVKVEDDIIRGDNNGYNGENCGKAMGGIAVNLATNAIRETAGHLHVTTDKEPGTGFFANADLSNLSSIAGYTDSNGLFSAEYNAGIFGLEEMLTAKLPNNTVSRKPSLSEKLTIKIPDLVPLTLGNPSYTFLGGTSPCDRGHNDSPTERRSHYVTLPTLGKVIELNQKFKDKLGFDLSLNDASLPYGGMFDSDSLHPPSTCHVSHRYGIDFDVNVGEKLSESQKDEKLRCDSDPKFSISLDCFSEYVVDGLVILESRRRTLDKLATSLGLTKIREATLHYRARH